MLVFVPPLFFSLHSFLLVSCCIFQFFLLFFKRVIFHHIFSASFSLRILFSIAYFSFFSQLQIKRSLKISRGELFYFYRHFNLYLLFLLSNLMEILILISVYEKALNLSLIMSVHGDEASKIKYKALQVLDILFSQTLKCISKDGKILYLLPILPVHCNAAVNWRCWGKFPTFLYI